MVAMPIKRGIVWPAPAEVSELNALDLVPPNCEFGCCNYYCARDCDVTD